MRIESISFGNIHRKRHLWTSTAHHQLCGVSLSISNRDAVCSEVSTCVHEYPFMITNEVVCVHKCACVFQSVRLCPWTNFFMFALLSVILVTKILIFVMTGQDDEQEAGKHGVIIIWELNGIGCARKFAHT